MNPAGRKSRVGKINEASGSGGNDGHSSEWDCCHRLGEKPRDRRHQELPLIQRLYCIISINSVLGLRIPSSWGQAKQASFYPTRL